MAQLTPDEWEEINRKAEKLRGGREVELAHLPSLKELKERIDVWFDFFVFDGGWIAIVGCALSLACLLFLQGHIERSNIIDRLEVQTEKSGEQGALIKNGSPRRVQDVRLNVDEYGASGTLITSHKFTLFRVIKPHDYIVVSENLTLPNKDPQTVKVVYSIVSAELTPEIRNVN